MRTAVVLMNLGGPDSLQAVEPFLENIFGDPDVIQLPLGFLWQRTFARKVARKRGPESRANYAKIGGRSPILDWTRKQAAALGQVLGPDFSVHIAMRAWHPFTEEAVDELVQAGAERVVGLPLYPHRSRTTTGSSEKELRRVLARKAPGLPLVEVCCYPEADGLVDAWSDRIRETLQTVPPERRGAVHVLFSAHGLPQSVIESGDPYLSHVERTRAAVMARFPEIPHSLAFQSRATKVKWLEPATEHALAALAREGVKDVLVVPIAFLTEHVETTFELDMLIRDMAVASGIEGYYRVPAPGVHPRLIAALAEEVERALSRTRLQPCGFTGAGCPGVRAGRSDPGTRG